MFIPLNFSLYSKYSRASLFYFIPPVADGYGSPGKPLDNLSIRRLNNSGSPFVHVLAVSYEEAHLPDAMPSSPLYILSSRYLPPSLNPLAYACVQSPVQIESTKALARTFLPSNLGPPNPNTCLRSCHDNPIRCSIHEAHQHDRTRLLNSREREDGHPYCRMWRR